MFVCVLLVGVDFVSFVVFCVPDAFCASLFVFEFALFVLFDVLDDVVCFVQLLFSIACCLFVVLMCSMILSCLFDVFCVCVCFV